MTALRFPGSLVVDEHIVGTDPNPSGPEPLRVGGAARIQGSPIGGLAIGGDFYNHVVVAVGYNSNPLTQPHQVAYWNALESNAFCTGAGSFLAGHESAIRVGAGTNVVERAAHFVTATLNVGAGSSVTRTYGMLLLDEVNGANNAAISTDADTAFTGNWFIHYIGTRPSLFGGAVQINGNLTAPPEIRRSAQNSFVRLAGGDFIDGGANILLFGPTHATNPNEASINASVKISMNGLVVTTASATALAGFRLPHGAAPTSPVNGDVWSTTSGLFIRINGVTKTVTLT